ncbi:hypothetical protein HYE68_005691 [Fusarium pseudograminearum]|nr:hypothetical protein HYE68_005691 [Fusarium pseudograminearum]
MPESIFYTFTAYAALIGVGYVVYHMSTQKARAQAKGQIKPAKTVQPETRKEDRKKKQRQEAFASEAQESSKKPKADPETSAWSSSVKEKDENIDNREFARQLAKAKEGTKLAAKADTGKQREKSVKQSRANKVAGATEKKESAQSSTTGADADDDQSPVTTPDVTPAPAPAPAVAVAGDVSDMLEAAPARQTVLRVTDTEPKKQNKKAAKVEAPVESKKQRQNRKKAEAAKAAREENEKERKALEEQQRRAARIAEGRAAKDGSQFTAAQAKSSAWKEGTPKAANDAPTAQTNGFHQPLDTFEKAPSTSAAAPKADNKWIESLPSEEEQLQQLQNDDEWSTVKTKSKKTAKNAPSAGSGDEVAARPAAQPKQPTGSNKAVQPSQSYGSYTALTTKDDGADEDEEEEEWDV